MENKKYLSEEEAFQEFFEKNIKPYTDPRDELLDHAWRALVQLSHEFRLIWEQGKRFDEMYYWLKDSQNRLTMMSDIIFDDDK